MKNLNARMVGAIALAVGVCAASSANAASTWVFGGVDNAAATTSYAGTPSLAISGAYAANNTTTNSGFAAASTAWVVNSASSLLYYAGGGLGMASDGSTAPNHAIDNVGVNTEAVLLHFGSSIALTSIGIGFLNGTGGDADISLFRYSGAGSPTLNGTNATTMTGWTLVGNYVNLAQDTTTAYNLVNASDASGNATASSQSSSWWLISAFNTAYGSSSTNRTQGNDYFKIYGVTGSTTGSKVPEPASLALMGIGLLGIFSTRRRKQSATPA